jgi:hypothetical protein
MTTLIPQFQQQISNAQNKFISYKLKETVSVWDFMTSAQIDSITSGGSTDVTTAVQNAINTNLNVFFPAGTYYISSAIAITTSGQRIYGESRDTTLINQTSASANGFTITGSTALFVEKMKFNCSATSTVIGISLTGGNETYFTDLYIQNFKFGFNGTNTNQCYLERVSAVNNTLDGVLFASSGTGSGACIDTTITNCYFAGSGSGGNGNNLAFQGNCSGIYVSKISNTLSANTGVAFISNSDGAPNYGFFSQIICDSCAVNGFNILAGTGLKFVDCWASNRGTGYNFFISSSADAIQIIGGEYFNCYGNGIDVRGTRVNIVGSHVYNTGTNSSNTYDGININGANEVLVSGVRVSNTSTSVRYGVSVTNSASNVQITGCDFGGYATATTYAQCQSGPFYWDNSGVNVNYLELKNGNSSSIANGATATLITLPAIPATYLFFANQYSQAAGVIRAMGLAVVGTSYVSVVNIVSNQATFSSTGSDLNVQLTNSAGGATVFQWNYIRI